MSIYEVVAFRASARFPADVQETVMQIAADRWLIVAAVPTSGAAVPTPGPVAPGLGAAVPTSAAAVPTPGAVAPGLGSVVPTSAAVPLALSKADFAITDVTGKWREIPLAAPSKILANAVDVEALLAGRNCARTALFDCPAIVQRHNDSYLVWIERSYEHAFNVAVHQVASI